MLNTRNFAQPEASVNALVKLLRPPITLQGLTWALCPWVCRDGMWWSSENVPVTLAMCSTFPLQVGNHLDKASYLKQMCSECGIGSVTCRGHSYFVPGEVTSQDTINANFFCFLIILLFFLPNLCHISSYLNYATTVMLPLVNFSSHLWRPLASGAYSKWKRPQTQAFHLSLMLWDFLQSHFLFTLHWKMGWQAWKNDIFSLWTDTVCDFFSLMMESQFGSWGSCSTLLPFLICVSLWLGLVCQLMDSGQPEPKDTALGACEEGTRITPISDFFL